MREYLKMIKEKLLMTSAPTQRPKYYELVEENRHLKRVGEFYERVVHGGE